MAFNIRSLKPTIRIVNLGDDDKFNRSLLLTSFNMSTGLFCFNTTEERLLIHCIDDRYFKKFNVEKTIKVLNKINEDDSI